MHGDAGDPAAITAALAEGEGPAVIYLALPPPVFAAAITAVAAAGLPDDSAIVIEKPFGHDLKSAQELNALLATAAPEHAIHRIDHFLEKQTVQNVIGMRFANRVFEPLWNHHHIERVEIVWDEDLALEGRAGYYDNAGALRDMIQNHLLQVLALVAMERPRTLDEKDLRDCKYEVLEAVRTPTPDKIASETIHARYTAGTSVNGPVPSYVDEPGIDAAKGTETFAAVTLHIDVPRWQGVPFILRTGKALEGLRQHVAIRFKAAPYVTFGQHRSPRSNILVLGPLARPGGAVHRRQRRGRAVRPGARQAGVHLRHPGRDALRPRDPGRAARRPHAVHPRRRGRGVLAHRRADPRLVEGRRAAPRRVPGRLQRPARGRVERGRGAPRGAAGGDEAVAPTGLCPRPDPE